MKDIYNSEANNRKIKKFNEAKARGQHIPFVPATFMSAGTRSIFLCPRQERIITLMSAGETRAYHCLIYDRNVVTVKEQYPLDYIKTQAIANKHGVIHPRDHQTGEVNIMTTDFLVEYVDKDGSHYKEAWSYKPELKAGNYARTQQKFEIEKAYWHAYGVKFGIKLDADVCNNTAYNYEELADQYTNHVSETELVEYTKAFLTFVARFPQETLRATLLELHERFSGQPSPRYLFANAVLRHILPLDVSQPIDFIEPARLLPV